MAKPKGYVSGLAGVAGPDKVSDYLGVDTIDPEYEADLESKVEQYIDRESKRLKLIGGAYVGGWMNGIITRDLYHVIDGSILLNFTPVASVATITGRTDSIGDPEVPVVADIGYELFDPALGVVNFEDGFGAWPSPYAQYVFVTYTQVAYVPADVSWAANEIIGQTILRSGVMKGRFGLREVITDDTTMTFDTSTGLTLCVPDESRNIIESYRPGFVFA